MKRLILKKFKNIRKGKPEKPKPQKEQQKTRKKR
jgi:hypothetical protein